LAVSALPESSSLSVVVDPKLLTGTPATTGTGFTSFFRPAEFSKRQTTFVIGKRISENSRCSPTIPRAAPASRCSISVANICRAGRSRSISTWRSGVNGNSPNYIIGVGYSLRWDNVLNSPMR
jgi:hypothetical protein